MSYLNQTIKGKQTLESVQYGVEIIFKSVFNMECKSHLQHKQSKTSAWSLFVTF